MPATGTEALISEALLQRYEAFAVDQSLPFAMPDVTFPAAGAVKPDTYLRANVMRAETQAVGINAWNEHAGVLQVDVVYKSTNGIIPPTNIADLVAAWFPRNWSCVNGAVRVAVYEPASVGAPVRDADPYKFVPVSVRYRVFTP